MLTVRSGGVGDGKAVTYILYKPKSKPSALQYSLKVCYEGIKEEGLIFRINSGQYSNFFRHLSNLLFWIDPKLIVNNLPCTLNFSFQKCISCTILSRMVWCILKCLINIFALLLENDRFSIVTSLWLNYYRLYPLNHCTAEQTLNRDPYYAMSMPYWLTLHRRPLHASLSIKQPLTQHFDRLIVK
jgi:hypothetical protein